PGILALFRMELDPANRAAAADRGVLNTVFGSADYIARVISVDIIGVNKIEVRPVIDACQEPVISRSLNLVPADLWYPGTSLWKPYHSSGHQSEASVDTKLVAFIEHELKSNAQA